LKKQVVKSKPAGGLVPLTIRVHREARKQLRISSATEEVTMEEKGRDILYRALGLSHLPAVVATSSQN
jgi:plasmid stability protein